MPSLGFVAFYKTFSVPDLSPPHPGSNVAAGPRLLIRQTWVGELLLKRLINEFRKAFRRNQKDRCLSTARFLAHLVNQKVAHELIVLELLTLLLEQTTDDSVEVAVAVLKECGAFLTRVVPKGVLGIFEHLRRILNEGQCDKRIDYMLEVMFQIRRDGWKDHPTMLPELDLIDEDDQITHTISLLDPVDPEDNLNIFRFDPEFEANEEKYRAIRASFLGDDDDDEEDASGSEGDDESGSGSEGDEDEDRQHGAAVGADQAGTIIDQTETNLVHLRRTIYLLLQSSISADEAAHRLLQLKIKPGEEYEVASMVLDCCAQTRSYETRYGQLAQRLCRVVLYFDNPEDKKKKEEEPARLSGSRAIVGEAKKSESAPSEPPRSYVPQFEKIFAEQYAVIHRLETAKLRNVALFFAHLLYTDSISWGVLECVALNERDTTSSGRIFLKHLFLELCSYMGLASLQARLRDETLQPFFARLLPRDNPKDTRFAINFLTTVGLGGLTLDLREFLQASKQASAEKQKLADVLASGSDNDGSGSSSSSSSESSSSDSESESSDSSSSSTSSSSSSSSSSSGSNSEDSSSSKRRKRSSRRASEHSSKKTSRKHHHHRHHRQKRDKPPPSASPPAEKTAPEVSNKHNASPSPLHRQHSRHRSPKDRRTGDDTKRVEDRRRNGETLPASPANQRSGRSSPPSRRSPPARQSQRRHRSPSPHTVSSHGQAVELMRNRSPDPGVNSSVRNRSPSGPTQQLESVVTRRFRSPSPVTSPPPVRRPRRDSPPLPSSRQERSPTDQRRQRKDKETPMPQQRNRSPPREPLMKNRSPNPDVSPPPRRHRLTPPPHARSRDDRPPFESRRARGGDRGETNRQVEEDEEDDRSRWQRRRREAEDRHRDRGRRRRSRSREEAGTTVSPRCSRSPLTTSSSSRRTLPAR
ncbi:pre-mRNA-splicing factor cwc22 [Sparganum proliferum]